MTLLLLLLLVVLWGCGPGPYAQCEAPGLTERQFRVCVAEVTSQLDAMERAIDRIHPRPQPW